MKYKENVFKEEYNKEFLLLECTINEYVNSLIYKISDDNNFMEGEIIKTEKKLMNKIDILKNIVNNENDFFNQIIELFNKNNFIIGYVIKLLNIKSEDLRYKLFLLDFNKNKMMSLEKIKEFEINSEEKLVEFYEMCLEENIINISNYINLIGIKKQSNLFQIAKKHKSLNNDLFILNISDYKLSTENELKLLTQ